MFQIALQYNASKFANSSEHHLHNAPFLVNKRAVGNCNLAIATKLHLWVASESVIMTLRLHKNKFSHLFAATAAVGFFKRLDCASVVKQVGGVGVGVDAGLGVATLGGNGHVFRRVIIS